MVPRNARARRRASAWLPWATGLLLLLLCASHPMQAQGCAQCLDSTRSTPPAVQASYRHAILLLGSFGVALFSATLVLIRRVR